MIIFLLKADYLLKNVHLLKDKKGVQLDITFTLYLVKQLNAAIRKG